MRGVRAHIVCVLESNLLYLYAYAVYVTYYSEYNNILSLFTQNDVIYIL